MKRPERSTAARRATISDVAKLAGVSIKTVSRVFNREPHVRPATRDKVISAAETLDYRPNLSARQLASDQRFVIGMLYDNPNAAYVTEVQQGSLRACREFGYNLLIHPCRANAPDLLVEILRMQHQVDGLIVLQPLSDLDPLLESLVERGIPCVRVSQRPFEGVPWISVGDTDAADEMTEYLLGLGHRRIGFIVGHPEHGQSHDRLEGYRRALERHEIPFDRDLIVQGDFEYDSGFEGGRRLLETNDPPTAIFASNDPMAMGVLSSAHRMGLRVPEDLSVAGFDDSPMARHASPPLTTVRQPIDEVAHLATEVLLGRIRGRTEGAASHRLKAELVRRESTAAPQFRRRGLA